MATLLFSLLLFTVISYYRKPCFSEGIFFASLILATYWLHHHATSHLPLSF